MRAPLITYIALAAVLSACGGSRDETPPATPAPAASAPAAGVAAAGAGPEGAGPDTTTTIPTAGLTLGEVILGRSVNPDNTMRDASRVFVSGDTVYASVTVEGTAPSAAVVARWSSGDGQMLYSTGQTIVPAGRTIAAFTFTRRDGIPLGSYHVDILLNGVRVGGANFDVGH